MFTLSCIHLILGLFIIHLKICSFKWFLIIIIIIITIQNQKVIFYISKQQSLQLFHTAIISQIILKICLDISGCWMAIFRIFRICTKVKRFLVFQEVFMKLVLRNFIKQSIINSELKPCTIFPFFSKIVM